MVVRKYEITLLFPVLSPWKSRVALQGATEPSRILRRLGAATLGNDGANTPQEFLNWRKDISHDRICILTQKRLVSCNFWQRVLVFLQAVLRSCFLGLITPQPQNFIVSATAHTLKEPRRLRCPYEAI